MFFSEKKLRELASISNEIELEEIIEAINSIGFEVENVNRLNSVEGVKFGYVLKTYKNPNSSKLTVCEIKFNDCNRIIQTAATNVREGDYLISFIPGSKLKDTIISKKIMANIESEGMLASLAELGFDEKLLSNKYNEILILNNKIDLNEDPIKYLELQDNIIEVSILSNRSDAQSYEVFANELSAYFHTNHKSINLINSNKGIESNIKLKQTNDIKLNGIEINTKNFKLNIKDIILLLKSNIKLEDNEFINFSNLCYIYTGVSLRAFDLNKINSNITIKKEHDITYLNDNNQNISILGVDVIEEFLPTTSSTNVLFEFSQIDSKIVRDNSKKSKKNTISSINNSRIISSGMIELATKFIKNFFVNSSNNINEIILNKKEILFDEKYLNEYAGFEINKKSNYKKALKSLEILGFKFDNNKIYVPNNRHDINGMQSIVEEIFRFYNFNNFEPIGIKYNSSHISPINFIETKITYLGYTQAWTYTLINNKKNIFNPFNFNDIKLLKTFVSEEYNSIRNSMTLTLLNVFDYNFKKNIKDISLFDKGMINDKNAIIIASTTKTFEQLKNDIFNIANQKFEVRKLENNFLHPNYNCSLFLAGKMVGWIGKLNPTHYSTERDIIFAEILEDCIYESKNKYKDYDPNPLKERDITFQIEKDFELELYLNRLRQIDGIFLIKKISTFRINDVEKITYRILMDDKALIEFENINWENKNKFFEI